LARADEALHLHVLARDVVDEGRHHMADVGFLELYRSLVSAMTSPLSLIWHAHARRLGRDVMFRVLLPAGPLLALIKLSISCQSSRFPVASFR